MSITVNQIVLHQLVKNVDGDSIKMESVLRDELLSITPEVEQIKIKLRLLVCFRKSLYLHNI